MGNMQCGVPLEDEYFDREMAYDAPFSHIESNAETTHFIQPHLSDRPEKRILDPNEVAKALMTQAEELVRRDFCETSFDKASVISDDGSFSQITDFTAGVSSIHISNTNLSEIAPSVTTSGSAATRIARNAGSSGFKLKTKSAPVISRPFPKGKEFAERENLLQDIESVLKIASEEISSTPLALAFGSRNTCIGPLACVADQSPSDYGQHVREYLGTLHLKMKPHFAEYYKTQLSRFLPDNPITQAVCHGISPTRLSPPRSMRRLAGPEGSVSTDSTASSQSMDFGVGPPSNSIRMLVTDSVFMDLAITGTLGLVDRKKSSQPRVTTGKSTRKCIKSPEHYMVLLNRRSGFPLAVCALKSGSTGPPVVRVYATKRRVFGQRPAAMTGKLGLGWTDSFPLYTWAEIVTEGRYPDRVRYAIYIATGSDGRFEDKPSYLAVHESSGSPEIQVVGQTERETSYTGCALLSLCSDDDALGDDNVFLRLSIAKGIDPALLLCFAAFVDEAMEKTMRIQCQRLMESNYKKTWG
jgi:hypothetical protein